VAAGMAFTQKGSTDYTFGFDSVDAAAIAAAVGLKPQTLSLNYEPEFTAEAQDENGEVASLVIGQDKVAFTLSGYITDEALLSAATEFSYDGRFYIVMGKKIDHSNTEFRKGELTGMSYAGIVS
jgi:hypothetical protein